VPQQKLALGSIRAALAPSGRAMLRFVPAGPRKCLEDVIEETALGARWQRHFTEYQRPYAHFTADEYRAMAAACGLCVASLTVEDKAWDFQTRAAFTAFARATFVEWTSRLPEGDRDSFIADVLERYQAIAADNPAEANTFKFYQMLVELTPATER
jgi:trans-aconitate 2-methyltransferase